MPTPFDSLVASCTASDKVTERFKDLNKLQRAMDDLDKFGKRLNDALPSRGLLPPLSATQIAFEGIEQKMRAALAQDDWVAKLVSPELHARQQPEMPMVPIRCLTPAASLVARIRKSRAEAEARYNGPVELLFSPADGSTVVVETMKADGPDLIAITGSSGGEVRTFHLGLASVRVEYVPIQGSAAPYRLLSVHLGTSRNE